MTQNDSSLPASGRTVSRVVPEPSALKALAHPERLRMLGLLRTEGPATASGLARRLGLNSGATSYHLRQLARHGFIEPAQELDRGRERWWRARHEATYFDTAGTTGAALEAGLAMSQAVLSQQAEIAQAAHDGYRDLPEDWRRASGSNDVIVPLTAEAALALQERLVALLMEAKAAAPAADAPLPEGTRNYMVIVQGFPFPQIAPKPEDER